MGKTKENSVPKPTTLDEALGVIDAMTVSIEALQREVSDLEDADHSCAECSRLESQIEELEDRVAVLNERTTDLVKIRHAIKRGTVNDDHVYQLEKLLSELDSGWMCRA